MRILWHGVDPRYPTGYGLQTALFAPRIASLGHQVVISSLQAPPEGTAQPGWFEGLQVIGPGTNPGGLPHLDMQRVFGLDGPDLIVTLKDCWTLPAGDFRRYRTLALCPVDTATMSVPDQEFFSASAAVPGAISKHGLAAMRAAGLDPVYVPHGIETAQWCPSPDKQELREYLGLPGDAFLVGMNAANLAGPGFPSRKGFDEAFAAFAVFARKHPRALLLCHTNPYTTEGIDLLALRHFHGLDDRVIFPASTEGVSHGDLLSWYQALDVFLQPTYGEGFGLPVAEALACGVPVIATECTSMPELVGPSGGWLVPGQQWWNPHHITHWTVPSIPGLANALFKAHAGRRAVPAGHVAHLDADRVLADYWAPALEEMADEPGPVPMLTSARRGGFHVEPGTRVAVLVPSRGRPASVARLAQAVKDTAVLATDVWFGFDADDPELRQAVAGAGVAHALIRDRMGLAPWTNELAAQTAGSYDVLVSMGDDHVPRTPGWDAELVKALRGVGMAYPNDLVRDDICEVVAMSSVIVGALGWMCPPALDHWFIDNAWADLGKTAGCLAYCPDVIVEHLHHSQHKEVAYDQTYSYAFRKLAGDKMAYDRWRAGGLVVDAARVAEVTG